MAEKDGGWRAYGPSPKGHHQDSRNWHLGLDAMSGTLCLCLCSLVSELASFSSTVEPHDGEGWAPAARFSNFSGNRGFSIQGKNLSIRGMTSTPPKVLCAMNSLPWILGLLIWLFGGRSVWWTAIPGLHSEVDMIPIRKRGTEKHAGGPVQRATRAHYFQPLSCLACAHTRILF